MTDADPNRKREVTTKVHTNIGNRIQNNAERDFSAFFLLTWPCLTVIIGLNRAYSDFTER